MPIIHSHHLHPYIDQLIKTGQRRLVLMSGSDDWIDAQLAQLKVTTPGDFLWMSDKGDMPPSKAKTRLGQEYRHAIIDVRKSFALDAIAMLVGTLSAGSLCILITPNPENWSKMPDLDSLRWHQSETAIATPNFIRHVSAIFQSHQQAILIWQEGRAIYPPMSHFDIPIKQPCQPPKSVTVEQQQILTKLLKAKQGIFMLTAKRGRGKSAVAGLLAQHKRCWVTALQKKSIEILSKFANQTVTFYAPDHLLQLCESASIPNDIDWLIIDEAAAIPLPILTRLLSYFPAVLMTTTIDGYEGTGQGFSLKLQTLYPQSHSLLLHKPIRWAESDSLEKIIEDICLIPEERPNKTEILPQIVPNDITYQQGCPSILVENPPLLNSFYQLLYVAHYRTTPLDLRRLLDAPGMQIGYALNTAQRVIGAVWAIEEGGLSPELAHQIWAGRRRPKGNLVAQALTAFAGETEAACLHSLRISRIAIEKSYRKQGIAASLILQQKQKARMLHCDFLSVSFGYTPELYAFWQQCGFSLVHVGTHQEASSGSYAMMMMLALSDASVALYQRLNIKLQRNLKYINPTLNAALHIDYIEDNLFTEEDHQEVCGFAYAHRTLESAKGSLYRLLIRVNLSNLKLHRHLINNEEEALIIQSDKLSGRRELIMLWRQEAQDLLNKI